MLVGLFLFTPTYAFADAKDDLKNWDGVWKVTRAEKEGKVLPDEETKAMKVTVKEGKIIIKDSKDEDVATLKIDSTKNPATVDFIPSDDEKILAPGIYAFDGKTLKICWARVGGVRPKEFASTMESETRLMVLTKEK